MSPHTKYNVHVIFLWGPSVTPRQRQIPRERGPLALPTHHLLTWSLHVYHVSVYGDHGKLWFM